MSPKSRSGRAAPAARAKKSKASRPVHGKKGKPHRSAKPPAKPSTPVRPARRPAPAKHPSPPVSPAKAGQAASGQRRSSHDRVLLDTLQANIGHFFENKALLLQALTHPSAAIESRLPRRMSYERMEFFGDSLVNAYLAELLFERFPAEDEGVLTRLRAYYASQTSLAAAARGLRLGEMVRLGAGEERDQGGQKERILASVLEALFAALYLDAGFRTGGKLARKLWADAMRRQGLSPLDVDAKTALQERRQALGLTLPYYVSQPADDGFVATIFLDGTLAGQGRGPTRKAAEQAAARQALARLGGSASR